MAETDRIRIGCIAPAGSSTRLAPHLMEFGALVPEDVQMEWDAIGLAPLASFHRFEGQMEIILRRMSELVEEHQWQGVILRGAPPELKNPGLTRQLQETLKVPLATALLSTVAALKTFSAHRILVMTPFDEPMNQLLRDHLARAGIEAISPPKFTDDHTEANKLGPDAVYALTRDAMAGKDVDAVYFQGAGLDPLKVIQRLEDDLQTTVVASNPAMLWYMLSSLGRSYQIGGTGRLLQEWPQLPAG